MQYTVCQTHRELNYSPTNQVTPDFHQFELHGLIWSNTWPHGEHWQCYVLVQVRVTLEFVSGSYSRNLCIFEPFPSLDFVSKHREARGHRRRAPRPSPWPAALTHDPGRHQGLGQERQTFVFFFFFSPCIAKGVCLSRVYLGWKRKLAGSMMHGRRVSAWCHGEREQSLAVSHELGRELLRRGAATLSIR